MPDDTFELALGLSRNLRLFKQTALAAHNYIDLHLDPYATNFAERISVEMHRASQIHFDLSGMRMLNSPDGVLHGPTELNPLGSTNWELRTIWDSEPLRAKTMFYRDGRLLSFDEVQQLP